MKKSGLGPKRVAGILIACSPDYHSNTFPCVYVVVFWMFELIAYVYPHIEIVISLFQPVVCLDRDVNEFFSTWIRVVHRLFIELY